MTAHLQEGEIPHPILFNTWKHHAATLRQRIAEVAAAGPTALAALPSRLVVIGMKLMDLYTGTLTPQAIGAGLVELLDQQSTLSPERYQAWVQAAGGFRTLTLSDQSVWLLRCGDLNDRYVHVHPGRWTPHTRRVRANVLKTAIVVLTHAAIHGGDVHDVRLINTVRQQHLGLSPIRELSGEGGLAAVLAVLR
jgi:hypothetical protein